MSLTIMLLAVLLGAPTASPQLTFADACVTPTERTVLTFEVTPWPYDGAAKIHYTATLDNVQIDGTATHQGAGVFVDDVPGRPDQVKMSGAELDLPSVDIDYLTRLGVIKTHACP